MRIYNEIVFDIDGNVIYEDSYEYSGEVISLQDFDPDDFNKDGTVNILDIIQKLNAERAAGVTSEGQLSNKVEGMVSTILTGEGSTNATVTGENVAGGSEYQENVTALGGLDIPVASLPSISNVGAVPFSGTVNWNAIPGGFQPLPQVAGQRKKLYQLSQFHGGINQKSSPRDISDQECQEAENITFSQIGRIKVLGDLKSSTSTGLTATTLIDSEIPDAGYGWFIFKSGYSLASTPVVGNYTVNITQDGTATQIVDNGSPSALTLTIANDHDNVAPVYYAAGGGLYACDANFVHTTSRQAAILSHRKDYDSSGSAANLITKAWTTGAALIASPTYDTSATDGSVNLEWQDEMGSAFTSTTVAGSATVHIGSSGTGTWNGNYYFYISWLFDTNSISPCETGLTSLVTTSASAPNGPFTFANQVLNFNFSVEDNNSTRNHIGGNARIDGARIYFKESGTTERFQLAEINLIDGIKGSLDSTYTPWDESATDTFDLATNIIFDDPPEIKTYLSENGYYSNELYDESHDTLADGIAGPAALDVRYKAAVIGAQGVVYIGNVIFNARVFADGMMYSMPGKPGLFPQFNFFDSPSSDGSPIMALASFRDTILQFKENALYVINVATPGAEYAQASFRDCGVFNPCQVFTTSFGVIFANKHGCFIYDGRKVISLTNGKFDWVNQSYIGGSSPASETSSVGADGTGVPSVGYDPRSQSIIVLKDIGHESTNGDAWIYNLITQSWTEGAIFIDNNDNDVHSNFQISPNGYLSVIHYDASDPPEAPYTYNISESSSNVQTITYITKDIDFGLPSQTKKIMKIYVTYRGSGTSLTGTYGADGDTTPTQAMTNSETSDGTLTDAGDTDHNVATFTLDSHPSNLKSIALKFTGSVGEGFEINDISILYRPRPVK